MAAEAACGVEVALDFARSGVVAAIRERARAAGLEYGLTAARVSIAGTLLPHADASFDAFILAYDQLHGVANAA